MEPSELASLITAIGCIIWPILVCILLIYYRSHLGAVLNIVRVRFENGAAITVGIVTIGEAVGQLRVPAEGDVVTDDSLALIHRSWRVPEKDADFGTPMYQIHVILFGPTEALQRVEYVIYRLEQSYPRPVQTGGALETNFELKELANGYSLIRAEVHIKGQKEPVRLSRFIDLTEQSPRLRGTYQNMARFR